MKQKTTMKKMIFSIIMLVVSLVLLSTATYAWFSMNTIVTATNMQVKAKAEEGLVISNAPAGTYDVSASTTKTTVGELQPGSTADLQNWWHSNSSDPANENTGEAYTAGVEDTNYVVHNFYIRSSAATAMTVTSLDVKEVRAQVSNSAPAQLLSKSLRVGVKIGSDFAIYAPVTGYTASYGVWNGSTAQDIAVTPKAYNSVYNATGTTSIPANTSNGILVQIFVWFEGEDESCISNNILSVLETLVVSVDFTYTV